MAFVQVQKADEDHNKGLLRDIARIVARQSAELKWRLISRHVSRNPKTWPRIAALLATTRMRLCCFVVCKTAVGDESLRDTKDELLLRVSHLIPGRRILSLFTARQAQIDVFIDRGLSPVGRRVVEALLMKQEDSPKPNSVTFVDSKRIKLVQLADICAGLVREVFVGLEQAQLPNCRRCSYLGERRSDCSWAAGRRRISASGRMNAIRSKIITDGRGAILGHGLLIWPAEYQQDYKFVDCLMVEGKRKRSKKKSKTRSSG